MTVEKLIRNKEKKRHWVRSMGNPDLDFQNLNPDFKI